MLKTVSKSIIRQLSKLNLVTRKSEAQKIELEGQRIVRQLELISRGNAVRGEGSHKTSVTISDEGVLVEYMAGREGGGDEYCHNSDKR